MNNKYFKWIVCVAMSLSLMAPYGEKVFAQTIEDTRAEVQFSAGTGPTNPVDPDEPDEELPGEGVGGSIVIVSVSDFNFGQLTLQGITSFNNLLVDNRPNIQIADLRGTGADWWVDAKLSSFVGGETGSHTLDGARIHIYDVRPNSVSNSLAPELMVTGTEGNEKVTLESDNRDTRVFFAGENAGMGLWVMRFYPEGAVPALVQLEIPGGTATLGSYSAIITWTLGFTP